uniref:SCP2 domain-containing protein n=1 Tax=Romanomermis culicivorax TaxID=13658 RepID=A0A915I453_ROMCU
MVENVGATFKFTISNGKSTKVWIIDCSKFPVVVQESSGKSDCEIIIGDDNMVDMALGKISADKRDDVDSKK